MHASLISLLVLMASPAAHAALGGGFDPGSATSAEEDPVVEPNCVDLPDAGLWFDGACRDQAWFEDTFALDEVPLIGIFVGTNLLGHQDLIVVEEGIDGALVFSQFTDNVLTPVGPNRAGYSQKSTTTVLLEPNDAGSTDLFAVIESVERYQVDTAFGSFWTHSSEYVEWAELNHHEYTPDTNTWDHSSTESLTCSMRADHRYQQALEECWQAIDPATLAFSEEYEGSSAQLMMVKHLVSHAAHSDTERERYSGAGFEFSVAKDELSVGATAPTHTPVALDYAEFLFEKVQGQCESNATLARNAFEESCVENVILEAADLEDQVSAVEDEAGGLADPTNDAQAQIEMLFGSADFEYIDGVKYYRYTCGDMVILVGADGSAYVDGSKVYDATPDLIGYVVYYWTNENGDPVVSLRGVRYGQRVSFDPFEDGMSSW